MSSTWWWRIRRIGRQLWFRAVIFSLLGIATALLAWAVKPYVPPGLSTRIGADAVDNVLGIIASSMLAVTTFSLSIMVSAYASATSNVTPRATALLDEDVTTQNALSTFIGSFLFSLVGIVALSTGIYGDQGRVVMFGVTALVIAVIVGTLLRWINHLSKLGRLGQTTDRVEAVAIDTLTRRLAHPHLGGSPLPLTLPAQTVPVLPAEVGYVQHVDMAALAGLADGPGKAVYVLAPPGAFVDTASPLAQLVGLDADAHDAVRAAFTLGHGRHFDQDPRFGVCVLSEVGQRALSAAINDSGTAIDVVGRGVRVLGQLATPPEPDAADRTACARVHVADPTIDDFFDDFFGPLARDSAALLEVGVRLQKALASLGRMGDGRLAAAAHRHAWLALQHGEAGLRLAAEREVLRTLHDRLHGQAVASPIRS